jgi:hypothetical protein
MFAANDPAKGGSFYLQSKIYRSKEVLEAQIEDIISGKTTETASATGTAPNDKTQNTDETKK